MEMLSLYVEIVSESYFYLGVILCECKMLIKFSKDFIR